MDNEAVSISEASMDDVASLERLDLAAGLESPFSSASFFLEMKAPRTVILMARSEEDVIGYLILSHLSMVAHIKRLLVSKPWRRHGVGRRLLYEAINTARRRKCSLMSLIVEASNHAARSLYQGLEFEEKCQMADYYGKGRMGLKLERKMSESEGPWG